VNDRGDLVPLDEEWALWRQVAIRGAGFAVDGLELFGDDEDVRLPELANAPRFREALTWQNRDALRNAVDRVSSGSGSDRRRRLATVASYWQRYCAKNDTIGFFGPLGWAELSDDGPGAVVEAGPDLVAARMTRFEVWAIDALAEALVEDPEVRRWVPLRRHPATLAVDLDRAEEDLCSRCDGRPAFEVGPVELIEKLVARGVLIWRFRVPLGPHPERDLREQLDAIADPLIRARCVDRLDLLEAALAAVAWAAGDAGALAMAFDELDATFESLTGVAAHRRPGEMYAGRSLCYEECRRDVTIRFGPLVVDELARALVPVLAGARWYTGEVWQAGCRIVSAALEDARAAVGASRVPLLEIWTLAAPRLMSPTTRHDLHSTFDGLDAVVAELQRRWAELLDGNLSLLTDRAKAMFADARPAWPRAVLHAPDVQIASRDVDALNRGDFQVVVGDFHPGTATVGLGLFLECHPEPDQVRGFIARHHPEPRLYLAVSRRFTRGGGRIFPAYATPADRCLLTADDTCMPSGFQCLNLADLWVDDRDPEPMITTVDGEPVAPLTYAFEHHIFLAGIEGYRPFRPVPHAPRITSGRTVLRRETWTFDSTELEWARRSDGLHAAAQAWATTLGMPRHVFALVAEQPKPIYVDFDSRALVTILSRQIRGLESGAVRFSEMLPDSDHAWLTDREGRRYTSELRLSAVDLTR